MKRCAHVRPHMLARGDTLHNEWAVDIYNGHHRWVGSSFYRTKGEAQKFAQRVRRRNAREAKAAAAKAPRA